MSNETKNQENEKKRYTIPDLVLIGDKLHNCNTAVVICTNSLPGQDENNAVEAMITALGKRDDIVRMLYMAMKTDDRIEGLFNEAVARINLEKLANAFRKIGGMNSNENPNENNGK